MPDLKPWEDGYVTPPPAPTMSKVDAGRLGGLTQAARREAGLPIIPPPTGRPGPEPDPESASQQKAEWETAENISDKRRAFLDRFVCEYLYDFNAPMAYIRAGGSSSHATTGGHEARRANYTQLRIREVTELLEEEDLLTRKEILLGLKKEANYHGDDGSSASRTRAWATLAKIKGMEAPTKIDQKVTHQGGIMLVPMVPNVTSWEEQASLSQKQLKSEVRK